MWYSGAEVPVVDLTQTEKAIVQRLRRATDVVMEADIIKRLPIDSSNSVAYTLLVLGVCGELKAAEQPLEPVLMPGEPLKLT